MRTGDGFIITLIVIFLAFWGYRYARLRMKRRLEEPGYPEWVYEAEAPDDDTARWLTSRGCSVLAGKKRLPVYIDVNENGHLQSRVFIDYIVEIDDHLFVVEVAKERKPLEMTGSGVRDRLLLYQLVVPGASGVLYADPPSGRLDRFVFRIEAEDDE